MPNDVSEARHQGWALVAISFVVMVSSLVISLAVYLLGGGGMPQFLIVTNVVLLVTTIVMLNVLLTKPSGDKQ